MEFRNQREFLDLLEREGQLKRIKAPISNKGKEIGALCHFLQQNGRLAAIVENPVDVNLRAPLVIGQFQSRERCAMAIRGTEYWEAVNRFAGLLSQSTERLEPKIVKNGSCKEIIIKQKDVDLRKQIPQIHWEEGEVRPYITSGLSFTKDPATGICNVGWYRYSFLNEDLDGKPFSEETQKREMGAYAWPINHLGQHRDKALEQGKALEVALVIGVDPALYVVGCASTPDENNDLALAGALRGAPLELVKCETVDLEVPADAEYVIEGELVDRRLDDPTIPGWLGYYGTSPGLTVFQVKCITHRKDPMMWGEPELFEASFEKIIQFGKHATLLSEVKELVPEVSAIYCPATAVGYTVIVQIERKPYRLYAQQVMHALWGVHSNPPIKCIVVVDKDIDPSDMDKVWWAIITRAQPYEDIIIIRDAPVHFRDPSHGGPEGRRWGSAIGIDATVKVPERFKEYPQVVKVSDDILEKVKTKIKPEFD